MLKTYGLSRALAILMLALFTALTARSASAQTLSPPTLTGITSTSSTLKLNWTPATGAATYDIYRNTTGNSGGTQIATGVTGTSYTDSGLVGNTVYHYQMVSVTSGGAEQGGYSNSWGGKTLDPPASITFTPAGGQLKLNWGAITGAFEYEVFRGASPNSEVAIGATASTSYTDTSLVNGTTYYYYVETIGTSAAATSYSIPSGEYSTSPFAAPTALSCSATGSGQISLVWSAGAADTAYNVYRSTISGGEGTTPIASNIAATSYVDTGATNGVVNYYTIAAVNGAYTVPDASQVSATPIANPTGLTATPGNANVVLNWPSVAGATGYNIYRGTSAGAESGTALTSVTGTTYTNTGLTNNTTYFYTIKAKVASYVSPASNEASATPTTPPATPTGLAAVAGNGQVALTWNSASGAVTYTVFRGAASGGEVSYQTGITGTSYTDAAAANTVKYYYTVASVNQVATSSQSSEVSARPSAPPPSGAVITVNTATPITGTTASLTGSATGTGALSYAWSVNPPSIGGQGVLFSPNPGANTTLTFPAAGTYTVTLTVTDPYNQQTTATKSITVNQTLTSIAVSQLTAPLNLNATNQFTATAYDQFGQSLQSQPTCGWSVQAGGVGSISTTGLYSAGPTPGSAVVQAASGGVVGTAAVSVVNASPTVATPASASPNPVTGTTTSLSVLGADDGGEPNLSYTWATTGTPPGPVTFTPNGTGAAARNTTATFSIAGSYSFQVTITDTGGLSTTSQVNVTVTQTATSIALSPTSATVPATFNQTFTAQEYDQFGLVMSNQPAFTWSALHGTVVGGPIPPGSVGNGAGLYTAPASTGPDTVTAADGSIHGSAGVTITAFPPPPSNVTITVNTAQPITGKTASLTGAATGTGTLTYAWSCSPPTPNTGGVGTFSPSQGTSTTLTFPAAGAYTITLIVTDSYGQQATATQTVSVNQTATAVSITPGTLGISPGGQQQFYASENDQFGAPMPVQPTWSWYASSGTVTQTGLYNAPLSAGSDQVIVTDPNLGLQATATITIGSYAAGPYGAIITVNTPQPITGTTASLTGSATDPNSTLTYTWSATFLPASPSIGGQGVASFSPASGATTTATFTAAGTYAITLNATDIYNQVATATAYVVVSQTETTVAVTPANAIVAAGYTRAYSATEIDQFGNPISAQPGFVWTSSFGTITSAGLYSAPTTAGVGTVTATDPSTSIAGTTNVTVITGDTPPTVATAAAANPNPTHATNTTLSVLGAYAGGESQLTYTWALSPASIGGVAPGPVTFSVNGTNAAKTTTATFVTAGAYNFTVTITDPLGVSVTSSVLVVVTQYSASMTLSPANSSVSAGGTQQFTANVYDQFGHIWLAQPQFTWTITSGGGFVSDYGLYQAPNASGTATIQAALGALSLSATVTVTNHAPTIVYSASASPSTVTGTSAVLSVLASDDDGDANLTYTWSCSGPAPVTYSSNGLNSSKSATAFFRLAGQYVFTVTITDIGGNSSTSSVSVSVNQTPVTLIVNPASSTVPINQTQQFTASGIDQFGSQITGPLTCFWSTAGNAGGISSSGVFSATRYGLSTITAKSGLATGSTVIRVTNGLTVGTIGLNFNGSLQVAVQDDTSNYPLSYNWFKISGPGDFCVQEPFGNIVVSASGQYTIAVTVTDAAGQSATSPSYTFTIQPGTSYIFISPWYAKLGTGQTAQFAATAIDQYYNPMTSSLPFTWASTGGSVAASGTNNQNSTFTANSNNGGSVSATVTFGGSPITGYGQIYGPSSSTPTTPSVNTPSVTPNPVTGTTTSVSESTNFFGSVDAPYFFRSSGPAPVAYSSSGQVHGANQLGTFFQSGIYQIWCTVTFPSVGPINSPQVSVTVAQTLTSIQITGNPQVITSQQCTCHAVAYDQFGLPIAAQPSFSWSVTFPGSADGTIDSSSGVFTAGNHSGSGTIFATTPGFSQSTTVTIYASPPTVQQSATASPTITTGSSSLSVVGQDAAGEQNLTYMWLQISGPSAAHLGFSGGGNGLNSSKNCTVSFDPSKYGSYVFQVTITNLSGLSVTSTVTVGYVPNGSSYLVVLPQNAAINVYGGEQYSAVEVDSYGNPLPNQPSFSWSENQGGVGYINNQGYFSAGPVTGTATITVTADGLTQSTPVTVTTAAIAGDTPPPGYADGVVPTDYGGNGPAGTVGVILPSLTTENDPGPDIAAYNPVGPSISFQRSYRSSFVTTRTTVDGLSPGWTDNYAQTITSANPAAWSPLTINYTNGGVESFTPTVNGTTATFTHPTGAPYLVTGVPSGTTGQWTSLSITYGDHTVETYTPVSGIPGVYLLSYITNIVGRYITINRDPANGYRVTSITNDAAQTLLQLNYTLGNLTSVEDLASPAAADHRQVAYTYDNNNLATVSLVSPDQTAATGVAWQYAYTPVASGDVTNQYLTNVYMPDPVNPASQSHATTNYDKTGHAVNVQDSLGRTHVYSPAVGNTTVSIRDNSHTALSWTEKYAASPYPSTPGMLATGVTNADTNSTSVQYNDANNPYRPTSATNFNGQTATITYADGFGNVATATDARGDITTNTYSYSSFPLGQLTSSQIAHETNNTIDTVLGTTSFTYYSNGLLNTTTTPAPGGSGTVTSTITYTALGDPLTVTTPGNNAAATLTTTYNYTSDGGYSQPEQIGQPLTVTDPAGDVTHFRYDGRGNVTQVTDAIGNTTNYAYNAADQQTSVQFPATGSGITRAHTDTTYEYLGGPVQHVIAYDENSNAVREVDYTYTANGEVAGVTGSTQPASYTYDCAGRVSTMTDGNGNKTYYDYNKDGTLLDERYPLSYPVNPENTFDTDTYTYDKDGNITAELDGRGVLKTYQRSDPESLVTGIFYSNYGFNGNVSQTAPVLLTYDLFGRETSMVDGTGTTADTYDPLGNILTERHTLIAPPTGTIVPSLAYSYYPDNGLSSMTIPDMLTSGKTMSSKYDLAGRLSQVTTPSGEVWNHSYLANGLLSSSSTTALNVAYTYNARGFLTSLTNSSVSHSSVLSSYTGLNYDALGNRQGFAAYLPQQTYTNPSTQVQTTYAADASYSSLFSYDTAHGLAAQNRDVLTQEGRNAAVIGSFSYDAAYNDVPVNADNQITSNNSLFDGQGNPSIYNNVPLTFDAENRLTAIGSSEFFSYDGAGRRVSKTLNGVTTYYNYSGSTLLSEDTFPTSGTPYSVLYQYAADGLRSAYYPNSPSASTFRASLFDFVFDPQGNLVQRLDSTESGVLPGVDKLVTYSAYGSPLSAVQVASPNSNIYQTPGGAAPTSIGFGGQYGYYTDESGLILLGARYYDPGTHRFLNRDPIGYKGGANLYAYCGGNPVNRIDPEGTDPPIGSTDWSGINADQFLQLNIGPSDIQQGWAQTQESSVYKGFETTFNIITSIPFPADPVFDVKATAVVLDEVAEHAPEIARLGESLEGVVVKDYGTLADELRNTGNQAHHAIQDAAVRDIPGYSKDAAPATSLKGAGRESPHGLTRPVQRQPGGGTYGAERRIGYKALRSAGFTRAQARSAIEQSDKYFEGIGVTRPTPTRIPLDRR